jgi:hypothetical protein
MPVANYRSSSAGSKVQEYQALRSFFPRRPLAVLRRAYGIRPADRDPSLPDILRYWCVTYVVPQVTDCGTIRRIYVRCT